MVEKNVMLDITTRQQEIMSIIDAQGQEHLFQKSKNYLTVSLVPRPLTGSHYKLLF